MAIILIVIVRGMMTGKCFFNYTNAMEESIGSEGVSTKDIDKLRDKIDNSYNKLMKKYEEKKLGFMDLIYEEDLNIYNNLKQHSKDFENIIVIGMGGSILGTQMVYEGIKGIYYNEIKDNDEYYKKVYFLDNSDPEKTYEVLNIINLEKTLIFAVSKSGNTSETLANFLIIEDKLKNRVKDYKKNIVIISNGGKLKNIAEKENYMFFETPKNVGGRFSVLSSVGLAPLSCMGIDIKKLIEGARKMDKLCKDRDIFKNPSLMNALIHYILYINGKTISVLAPYAERLHKFGMWYRQLWAESLGKNGKGQTPVVSVGAKDQHSQLQLYLDGPRDKIITFLKVNRFKHDLFINSKSVDYLSNHRLSDLILSELKGTEYSLKTKNIPNVCISIDELNEYSLGKLIYMYEMQTAFMGEFLEIDAFNQPSVEYGKEITRRLLKENKDVLSINSFNDRYIIEL